MVSAERRPYGHGSVDPRGGRYRARVRHGLRRITVGTYDTEAEADHAIAAWYTAMGETPPDTLAGYGPEWLVRRERGGYRDTGTDRSRWTSHVERDSIARLELHAVTSRDVRELLERVARGGAARETVRHVRTLLGALYTDAMERGDVASSPVSGVRLPRGGKARREWTYLTLDEIAAVEADRPWALRRYERRVDYQQRAAVLAIHTGLRQGELCGLRWDDLDGLGGDRPMMTIRRSWRGATKSERVRTIPILPAAVAILRALPRRGAWVLCTATGSPYTHGYDAGWGEGLRERLGVTRAVRWHDLRHTCASHLVSGSWGRAWRLEEVCEYLGHTSIEVTRRYAHLAPEALRATAAATTGPVALGPPGLGLPAKYRNAQQESNLRPSASEASEAPSVTAEDSGARDPSGTHVARAIIRELDQGAPASQEMVARLMASVLARPDVAAVLSLPGVPSEHLPARLIEAADLVLRCAASTSQSADSAAAGTRAAPAHP